MEKYDTACNVAHENILWRMRFASWITKATDTHPQYLIFTAFPRQQWLRERVSILRYTYSACLANNESGVYTSLMGIKHIDPRFCNSSVLTP